MKHIGNAKMSVVCCITPSEKFLEETRSTLQFASRAKLVKTNATVNEVLDEGVQLKRLKKELEELKDKQRTTGLSDEEANRISIMESEKLDLSNRLLSLQEEKDQQRIQLDKLREMIIGGVIGSDIVMDDSIIGRKKDRKKFRDTWCPGKGGAPLPSSFLGLVNNNVRNVNNDESFSSSFTSITKDDMDRSINESSNEITQSLEIDSLNKLINTRDETIYDLQSLNDNISEQMEMEIGASSEREKELITSIHQLKNELLHSKKTIESLKSSEIDSDNDVTIEMDVESNISNSEMIMKLHSKEEEISQASDEITSLKNELSLLKSNSNLNMNVNSSNNKSSEIITKLEEKVSELKNKLWSEESVSAASTEIISSLRLQLSELQDSNEMIEILETDLSESNLKIKYLDTKLIQMNHEHNQLKEELSQSHVEIEALKSQEDESMNASQDIINELESKIVHLEKELNQNKEVVLSMENMSSTDSENVISLNSRVKELENEIIQLQATATQDEESSNASQQIISDLESRDLESINSIENLNNRVEELEKEINQLQSNATEGNVNQEIVTGLELKISQITTLNSQLEEEASQNNEIISHMEQMSIEASGSISTLNNRVKELENEIIQLQATSTKDEESSNASQQIISDLESRDLESINSIGNLNNLVQELEKEINQLQSNATEGNVNQEIVNGLELKISQLLTSNSQLEEELSQSNEIVVHMEHTSSEASESVITLTSRVEELQDEIIQLQAAAAQDESCSKQSQDMINDLEAKIALITKHFECENSSFKEDYKLLQEALDESTSKNNDMEAEVKNAEEVLNEVEAESNVFRTDLKDAMLREEEIMKSLQTAGNESVLFREQVVYLESQLEGAISDSHEYQAVSKESEQKIIDLQEENIKMLKLDSYANDLKGENIKLQDSFDEVNRILSVEESKCVELIGQKEFAENKYHEIELELIEIKSLSSSTTNDTMITQESIEFARREMEKAVESMRSELGSKEAEVSRLMIELNTIQNRVIIAEQIVSQNITHSINTSDNDELKQKKLNQLQIQNDLLRGEKESALSQINDLEKELKNIINSSRNSQDQLNSQIDQLMSQNEKLMGKNSDSSQYVDSIKVLELKLCNSTKEFNEIELIATNAGNRVNELENELYDLKEILNQGGNSNKINQLNSKLEMVQTEKDQVLLKKNELERDLKEISNRLKKSKDENNLMKAEWSSSIDQTEETIKLLESEKLEMEDKLNESLIEISNLSNNKSSENNDEFIINIEELKLKLSETIDNFDKVKEDRDDLDYKLAMLKKDIINRDETINQLHTEINTITSNNLSTGDKDDELISEMNVLMESNLELGSRLSNAESQVKSLNEQLSNYDKSSAEEQDFIMRTAETQMDLLTNKLEESTCEVTRLNELVSNLQMVEVKFQEKILNLENLIEDKENSIDNIKKEYTSSKQLDKIHFTNNDNTIEKLNEQLEMSLEKNKQLKLSIDNTSKITDETNSLNNAITELKNEMIVKDKRITHLEAAKLTKDQVEKIKTLKEERKKFQEDSKTMKNQLHALKKTYDELKKSASSNGSTSTTIDSTASRELVDLKVQIAEVSGQLDSSHHITKTLKEKLRECSKQLQEYENERSAVVDVLMVHGVDVQGLLLHDTSISDDQSIIEQDLADAVEKLASNLNNIKNSTQENLTESISKIRILEENKEIVTAELEDLKMQHTVVERRLDTIKTNNRDHREEIADSKAEVESLKSRIEELECSLSAAEGAVSESSDNVSSEVQALEEENIDLMKENKELRKECSTYKILSERLQVQVNKLNTSNPMPLSTKINIPMSSSSPVQNENITNSNLNIEKRKRNTIEKVCCENDENSPPKRVISENIVPLATIAESNTESDGKVKRTRAKPLVPATTDKEGAQECTQS
jgi:chromosome segregation ATPase